MTQALYVKEWKLWVCCHLYNNIETVVGLYSQSSVKYYKMNTTHLLSLLWFISSPFLDAGKREALADYALVVAVLAMSLVASYFVRDIGSK